MKKLIIILLLLTSLIFISGCRNKNKTIDYMGIVEIPSLIEVDIEDVPDNLNTFIKVTDEINVVKVSVDTSKVNFDTPGDYSIIITVDYYDGVSKEFNSVLRLAFNDSIGVPVILGIKNRLLSPTSDEIDFLEGVAFSDNGKIIDSGVIGNVNLNTEGIYTLIYYAEDDDGNYVTSSSFIIVSRNLFFYDNFSNDLYNLSNEEVRVLREYSILYSAAYANNRYIDIQGILNYFGNFLSVENFEALLGRDLRQDEKNVITQMHKIFRKNDVIKYQEFFNTTLLSIEKEQFERAYELFTDYAASKNPYNVDTSGYIGHADAVDFYYSSIGELSIDDENAINKYSSLSRLSLDSVYFKVVKETGYEFDERILELDNHSEYSIVKQDITSSNPFINQISNQTHYTDEELLFADIYLEYYKYKLLYEMSIYLSEKGEINSSPYILEESYDIITTALEVDNSNDNKILYLELNLIDLDAIEQLLNRQLSTYELENMSVFSDAFNNMYTAPYTSTIELFGDYLSDDEIALIINAYKIDLFTSKFKPITYPGIKSYLGRELTDDEVRSIDLLNKYNAVFISDDDKKIIKNYNLTPVELEDLFAYDYQKESGNDVNPKIEFITYFERYYSSLDLVNYTVVTNVIDVLINNDLEPYVFERLIQANDINIILDNYNITFTADEKEILNDYIVWISNVINVEFSSYKYNVNHLGLCVDDCIDALNVAAKELFPSIFIINEGYNSITPSLYKRITGKEMSNELINALATLEETSINLDLISNYLSNRNMPLPEITTENSVHYKVFQELVFSERANYGNISMNLLGNYQLNTEERAAYDYFDNYRITYNNNSHKISVLNQFKSMGINKDIVSYLRTVDLANEYKIELYYTYIDFSQIKSHVTDPEDLEHIHKTERLFKLRTYYNNFIMPLMFSSSSPQFPTPGLFNNSEMIYAVEILVDLGYAPNANSDYYYEIYNNVEENPEFHNLDAESRRIVDEFIRLRSELEFKNNIALLGTFNNYSPEFYDAAIALYHKVENAGGEISWGRDSNETLLGLEFDGNEQFVFDILTTNMLNQSKIYCEAGMSYLGYEYGSLTLDELQASCSVDIPKNELYLHLPENIPLYSLYQFFIQDPFSSDEETSTQYGLFVQKMIDELLADIASFNVAIEDGTATLDELIDLRVRLYNFYEVNNIFDGYLIRISLPYIPIDIIDIDSYEELILESTPFILLNNQLNNEVSNIGVNNVYNYSTNELDYYRIFNYSKSFIYEIGVSETEYMIEYFQYVFNGCFNCYISDKALIYHYDRELTEIERLKLEEHNNLIVSEQLSKNLLRSTLSIRDQKALYELLPFFIEMAELDYFFFSDYIFNPDEVDLINEPSSEQFELLERFYFDTGRNFRLVMWEIIYYE